MNFKRLTILYVVQKKLKICENMEKDRYCDDYVKKMNDDIISNKIYINVMFGYNKYFKYE